MVLWDVIGPSRAIVETAPRVVSSRRPSRCVTNRWRRPVWEIIAGRVPTEYRPAGFHVVVRRIKAQNTNLVKAAVSGATLICVHPRPPVSSVVL